MDVASWPVLFLFLDLEHPLDERAPRAGEANPDSAGPCPGDLRDAIARETFKLEQNERRSIRLTEPVEDPIDELKTFADLEADHRVGSAFAGREGRRLRV